MLIVEELAALFRSCFFCLVWLWLLASFCVHHTCSAFRTFAFPAHAHNMCRKLAEEVGSAFDRSCSCRESRLGPRNARAIMMRLAGRKCSVLRPLCSVGAVGPMMPRSARCYIDFPHPAKLDPSGPLAIGYNYILNRCANIVLNITEDVPIKMLHAYPENRFLAYFGKVRIATSLFSSQRACLLPFFLLAQVSLASISLLSFLCMCAFAVVKVRGLWILRSLGRVSK